MKRETLIERLADLEKFTVVPEDYYERLGLDRNGGQTRHRKNKKAATKYNAGKDKRLDDLLSYSSLDEKGVKTSLWYSAYTIAANLSLGSLNTPSTQQMEIMLELTGYKADDMEVYVKDSGIDPSSLPSKRLVPTVFLLTRTLYDALVDPSEWRRTKRNVANPSLERLRELTGYMQEEKLLTFCERLNVAGSYTEYDESVFRHAQYMVKVKTISNELETAFTALKKRTKQLRVTEHKEFVEAGRRRGANSALGQQAAFDLEKTMPNLSNHRGMASVSAELQNEINQMNKTDALRALRTLQGTATGNDAMGDAEMQALFARQLKTLPQETQERMKKIDAEMDAASDYFAEIVEAADEEEAELREERKRCMREVEYIPLITESAFRAILTGEDEIYKLKIGRYIWQDFMMQSTIALPIVKFKELDDDDIWDNACPEMNGRLGLRIYDENDLMNVQTGFKAGPEQITMPLSAMMAKYTNQTADTQLYIRKSHVKMFKEAGYSDRRARDFAIVLAVLGTMHDLETNLNRLNDADLYRAVAPVDSDAGAESKQALETERRLRQAQKELQEARHEISKLQKENARLTQMKKESESLAEPEPEKTPDPEIAQAKETISYPYRTALRVVVYGGFEVFHKELSKLLPDVRVIESSAHIDINPVRSADIVFLQTNKTNHSNYWAVRDACKNRGIPYIHLNYASAKLCAEVIVQEIEKLEHNEEQEN